MHFVWSRRNFLTSAALLWQAPEKGVVVIVLGPPGAGKTTQAEFLKKKYSIPIFSAETLLKKSHDRKSNISKRVRGQMGPEELLTDQGMNDLVREAVVKADTKRGFLLDGYPLTKGQAEYLTALLNEIGLAQPLVVHLDISDATVTARLSQRGRSDDKPAIIERRLASYRDQENTVLAYYGASRILRLDGAKPATEISRDIEAALTRMGK